ncbi:lipoyl domain-containing protein [Rhizobium rhizogenes]|jgi:pyruvate/2-oxoglutarate dehydrogenase complex dihydrolipoamide acyltransferase (E2) component|uniref:lipoyl domain-containing protein n=1 Tax=Rhizobium rhizogenes TaxID=359 RepID=UPI003ECF6D34
MIYQLTVPAAVPGVDEIRVLEWHGETGRSFDKGELIVELETHKAVVEVRAGQAGVLRHVFAKAGDWKGTGLPLAIFSDDDNEDVALQDPGLADLVVEFQVT